MLNPEIKQKWIEELESGNYVKTTNGNLYYNGEYCVLGVLGKVLGKSEVYLEECPDGYDFFRDAGLTDPLSRIYGMNDGTNMTFHELAQWIKKREDI